MSICVAMEGIGCILGIGIGDHCCRCAAGGLSCSLGVVGVGSGWRRVGGVRACGVSRGRRAVVRYRAGYPTFHPNEQMRSSETPALRQ